jgi:hypothetical protein
MQLHGIGCGTLEHSWREAPDVSHSDSCSLERDKLVEKDGSSSFAESDGAPRSFPQAEVC